MGEFNRSDASVQVTGLKPGCYYSIRAVATNAANFSSLSPLIRLRTIALGGHDQYKPTPPLLAKDFEGCMPKAPLSQEEIYSSVQPPPSHQSHGYGTIQPQARRTHSGRRVTLVAEQPCSTRDHASSTSNERDAGDTIPSLTRKLDELRHEQEEMNNQIREEEDTAEVVKSSLIKERDSLKYILKEKEDAQLEVKKQVNELEKHSKAAQRKKSAKERLLQQRQAERQKMKEDVSRWEKEIAQLQKEVRNINNESVTLVSMREAKILEIQKSIDNCQTANKAMEEEIRTKGSQIKALEREKKDFSSLEQDRGDVLEQIEKGKDQAHEIRLSEFQAQFSSLWQKHQMVGDVQPG